MSENKSAADLAAETKAAVDKAVDSVKAVAEEALGKANAGEKLTQTLAEKADEALMNVNALRAKMDEMEQAPPHPRG